MRVPNERYLKALVEKDHRPLHIVPEFEDPTIHLATVTCWCDPWVRNPGEVMDGEEGPLVMHQGRS